MARFARVQREILKILEKEKATPHMAMQVLDSIKNSVILSQIEGLALKMAVESGDLGKAIEKKEEELEDRSKQIKDAEDLLLKYIRAKEKEGDPLKRDDLYEAFHESMHQDVAVAHDRLKKSGQIYETNDGELIATEEDPLKDQEEMAAEIEADAERKDEQEKEAAADAD